MLCASHALVDLNGKRVQICIMFSEPCSCQFKWRDCSNLFISFCVGHALVDLNGERVQIFVTFYMVPALVDLSGEQVQICIIILCRPCSCRSEWRAGSNLYHNFVWTMLL